MATSQQLESLIASLESTVQDALAYFEGPGATSQVKVGDWGPREVLCHCLFWHEATAQGMESVARGGEPFRVEGHVDEVNARAIAARAADTIPQLAAQARQLQQRLVQAARNMPDPDAGVLVRADGTLTSGRQRLELIARHWAGHIQELRG